MKRLFAIFISILIVISTVVSVSSDPANNDNELAIVFTHDLHSHIEPFLYNKETVGGFARIKTVIDNIKSNYKNSIVLDAGDFSMGTLFQSAFATEALEYRLLSHMGYDATALGNHELDYGFDNFKKMINSAKANTQDLAPILCCNIDNEKSNLSDTTLTALNIKEYELYSYGGFSVAVFGLLGRDAAEVATDSTVYFTDYIEAAEATVNEIKKLHSPDVIICLSHSGLGPSVKDEDIKLANKVDGINVIISAHTHTVLEEPIIQNDTIIVSCGEYGINVGELIIDINSGHLISYKINKIDNEIIADKEISNFIADNSKCVIDYLSKFGYNNPNQIIAYSPIDFIDQNLMGTNLSEQPLGNLISDSYIHTIKENEGDNYVNIDVSITPVGFIRSTINQGYITVSQAYEISSLGLGNDGTSGYPLCSVYLYGKELWNLAEIDASVSALMPYAQLYFSGLGYSANTNRMFLDRVYDCWLIGENNQRIEIEDNKLYRVVSGIASAEMLGTVKTKSFGLLSLVPKDINGNEITDFTQHIVTGKNGAEIKEWKALADYLDSFPTDSTGISVIPAKYANNEGRKNIYTHFSFSQIFCNWSFITWAVFAVVNALLLTIIIVAVVIIKKVKRKRHKKMQSNLIIEEDELESDTADIETTTYEN